MMPGKPMHCDEVARRLGVTLGCFYRRRHTLSKCEGMPAPITTTGRPAYDRAGMEAWLTRHDPRRPRAAANDSIAPPVPNSDAEWNTFLRQTYGQPAE